MSRVRVNMIAEVFNWGSRCDWYENTALDFSFIPQRAMVTLRHKQADTLVFPTAPFTKLWCAVYYHKTGKVLLEIRVK
jgi:hypothetical protein